MTADEPPAETITAAEAAVGEAETVSVESASATEAQPNPATILYDVEVSHTPTETLIYLRADGSITDFNEVRLGKNLKAGKPDRIYLDVNNVKLAGPIETKDIGTAVARVRTAQRKSGFRIVFDSSLDTLFDYGLQARADGIKVGSMRLKVAWPFPEHRIREVASQIKGFVVPELNMGQMALEVERCAAGKCKTTVVPHAGGTVHDPQVIYEAIVEAAK